MNTRLVWIGIIVVVIIIGSMININDVINWIYMIIYIILYGIKSMISQFM